MHLLGICIFDKIIKSKVLEFVNVIVIARVTWQIVTFSHEIALKYEYFCHPNKTYIFSF